MSAPPACFGLIVIGDEILSGKREDAHFAAVRGILGARGLRLGWAEYLGDDRSLIAERLRRSFAGNDIVFSCGGIGATPDDHTRQAAGLALGVPLELHPEAAPLIAARAGAMGLPLTPERLRLGEFPRGARLIPNPHNGIPGFSVGDHHFVPGFPAMAWPMIEWVLDTVYGGRLSPASDTEQALRVLGLAEGTLIPLLEAIERSFGEVRVFSLPHLSSDGGYEIELGVKGDPAQVPAAFDALRAGVLALGGRIA